MPRKAAAKSSSKGKKTPAAAAPTATETKAAAKASAGKNRFQRIFASAIVQKINKDAGVSLILKAGESKAIEDRRIPSGIIQLDLALGGGYPAGRVINLWGHKSSGKTTLLLKMIAQAQNCCSNCWTYVRWSSLQEVELPEAEEVTDAGEEPKKKGKKKDDAPEAAGKKKTKKEWVFDPTVTRWWAEEGKWRVLFRFDEVMDEETGELEKVPVLGAEIRPTCGCSKFRDTVCAYVDVEGALDKQWMLRQGVDIDRLILSQPALAEQALTVADGLLQTGEVDILVIDSIAFLRPKKEAEKTMEEGMVGEQARIVGRGTRSWVSNLNFSQLAFDRRPTIFTVNQVRMKVGVMFGNPETQPGGMAPGFAASIEIKTRAGKTEMEGPEDAKIPIEQTMFFDIEKNKTGVERKAGEYKLIKIDGELRRLGDVADEDFLMESAEQFGLVGKVGNDWVCLEEKFDAKGHISKKLLTDVPFSRALRKAVSEVARLKGLAGVRGLSTITTPEDEDAVEVDGEDVVEVEEVKEAKAG